MTKKHFLSLVGALILGIAVLAFAQTYGNVAFGPIAPALSNCVAGSASNVTFCAVGTGPSNYALYVSYNGAAYQLLVPAGAGVTSFNARTGAVLPATGDYNYSDLKNPPTTISCTTSSQSNSGFTASGCTIK